MKRIKFLNLLIIAFMLAASLFPAYAEETAETVSVPEYETRLLSSLGIEINFVSAEVTRGEFALRLASVAGGYVNFAEQKEMIFSDVSLTQADSASITAVYKSGLMNGVGEGKFAPGASISSQDAVVALVRLAGYEIMAKVHGGYPAGYIYAADFSGITDAVTIGTEALTPQKLSTLLYNTLHTDVYQLASVGDGEEYLTREGEDVLALYHKIYRINARVTANRFTSLVSPVTSCPDNCLELDGELYTYNYQSGEDNLGFNVDAYYQKYSSDKRGNIISMYIGPEYNESITVLSDDINSILGNTVEVFVSEKTKKINVIKGFNLIYNGNVIQTAQWQTLKLPAVNLHLSIQTAIRALKPLL
ncbi:MAG: S-layer homology domain-containing protein [Clostridia bacterium]|nr:S-layer homology domain-containing protein [Clostridia bacterium]